MVDKQGKSVKQRLLEFVKCLGLSNYAFEESVGLSNGYIGSIRKGVGYKALKKITDKYPDLNPIWLMSGEGEMFLSKSNLVSGAGNTAVAGTGNCVTTNDISGMIELLREKDEQIKEYQTMLREKDEQIKILLSITDKLSNK